MRSCHPLVAYPPSSSEADGLSTAQLVSRVADELSRLARDEFKLARSISHRDARMGRRGRRRCRASRRGWHRWAGPQQDVARSRPVSVPKETMEKLRADVQTMVGHARR